MAEAPKPLGAVKWLLQKFEARVDRHSD